MSVVDWRTTASLTGTVLKLLTAPLLVTAGVAAAYGEPLVPFLGPAAGSFLTGIGLERFERADLGLREGYLIIAITWLVVAVVGTLPFLLAGEGVLGRPVNALFEAMSGITTTGATVIVDFGAYSRSVLFWRGMLQWLGGLGILILAVALLSELSVGGAQLMERESQTQDLTKLTPRITQTARLLGGVYLGLTGLLIAVLLGLWGIGVAPNMGPYNAVTHALTTLSTAGFSPEPLSLGAFSPTVQWVVTAFMLVGATNFVLLYFLLRGRPERLLKSAEFRFYLGVVAGLTLLTAASLAAEGTYDRLEPTLRHASFQVVSLLTTTGYATVDFDVWGPAAKHLLFLAMFSGGMAGSTTCSIKTVRWLVVVKSFRRDLFTELHPEAIAPVRLGETVVDEATIRDIYGYVLLTLLVFGLATVFVVVDAGRAGPALTEFEAMGAAAATFLNIGPAFGPAGPYGTYNGFSTATKVVMTFLMWIGRIEIIPVLVLLTPAFWRP